MSKLRVQTRMNRNGRWQWTITGGPVHYESFREYASEAAALNGGRRRLRELRRELNG